MLTLRNITAAIIVHSFLSACAHDAPAPVVDLYTNSTSRSDINSNGGAGLERNNPVVPQSYQVKPGDTLYSIAWEYALDYEQIAHLNQLQQYRIYPDQFLQLKAEELTGKPVYDPATLLAALEKEVFKKPISKLREANSSAIYVSKNLPNGDIKSTGEKFTERSPDKNNIRPNNASKKRSTESPLIHTKSSSNSISEWIWPANGPILTRFSHQATHSKGLDIGGEKGQPVRATAPGKVVYKGSGLKGYGQLVIIKHNDDYLSAYAHNNRILVNENEVVKAGQRIADIGNSGANQDKLHFEIRFRGKPVDPLNYLPETN